MPDSKPLCTTGAVGSLKSVEPQPTVSEKHNLDLSNLGTHSLLPDWLNTEHPHERLAVRLSLPQPNSKGGSVKTKDIEGQRAEKAA